MLQADSRVYRQYLIHEKAIISTYLRQHFGYYLLLLGSTDLTLTNNSPVLIQIPVSAPADFDQRGPLKKIELVAEYDSLPFFPESVDVMVCAHALSELKNGKKEIIEVLKEAYKTLRHDGILIISELNNFSCSARKILKYLNQVGFDCTELERVSKKSTSVFNLFELGNIFSMGYVILAKKKTLGLTPLSLGAVEQLNRRGVREPLLLSEREGF